MVPSLSSTMATEFAFMVRDRAMVLVVSMCTGSVDHTEELHWMEWWRRDESSSLSKVVARTHACPQAGSGTCVQALPHD